MSFDNPKRKSARRRERRPAKPLDPARMEELALAYVARFATSANKLRQYLLRKLRERGFAEDAVESWLPDDTTDADASAENGREHADRIVQRFVEKGYVDDDLYAKTRASSLLSRGYGARRIEATLRHDGIAEDLRQSHAPEEAAAREAALALAKKRRFGPYSRAAFSADEEAPENERDFAVWQEQQKLREKQLAAMLRAGHDFGAAKSVLDAPSIAAAERWAAGEDDD